MKTVFYIPACIYSLTLLALTLSPVHAFVGEKESVFINWLKKHIGHSEQVSNYDDGVYKLITTWQIDLKNDIRHEPHILGLNPLSKLGHGVWEIQISSFYRYNKHAKIGPDGRKDKGNQIIYEISYRELKGNPKNTITGDQLDKILAQNNATIPKYYRFVKNDPKEAQPGQAEQIVLTSKELSNEIEKQQTEYKSFKKSYRCIDKTIEELIDQLEKPRKELKEGDESTCKFEKLSNNVMWTIEVKLFAGKAHHVTYFTKGQFTSTELDWLRIINAEGKSWKETSAGVIEVKGNNSCDQMVTADGEITVHVVKLAGNIYPNREIRVFKANR